MNMIILNQVDNKTGYMSRITEPENMETEDQLPTVKTEYVDGEMEEEGVEAEAEEDDPTFSGMTCREKWNIPLFRRNVLYSLFICFASLMWGWIIAIKGPSLIDLQQIAKTDTAGGATFFTSASIGGVVGAIAGGAIYDKSNGHLTCFISMLLYSVTCALIPYCTSFWFMVTMFFVHETVLGAFKTGCYVEMLRLWGKGEGKIAVQGLCFAFSLGATVSPFILEPFMSRQRINNVTMGHENKTSTSNQFQNYTGVRNMILTRLNQSAIEDTHIGYEATHIHFAYIISGILGALSSCGLLVIYFLEKRKGSALRKTSKKESSSDMKVPKFVTVVTLCLFMLLYFFFDEVEDSSPAFLATFVVQGLNWSKIYGARVTSAFWGSYTLGRLLGTITIRFVTHFQFFITCCCCLTCAQVGLLLSGLFHFDVGVWLSVVLAGISVSVVFPATITWMEKEFLSVSGKIVSVVFVAVSLGGMANPQVIGYTMQHVTYMFYCYILLTETLLFAVVLASLKLFLEKCIRRYKTYAVTQTQDDIFQSGKTVDDAFDSKTNEEKK